MQTDPDAISLNIMMLHVLSDSLVDVLEEVSRKAGLTSFGPECKSLRDHFADVYQSKIQANLDNIRKDNPRLADAVQKSLDHYWS